MAYQSKHTGSAIDGAIDVVIQKNAAWDNKQDKLTGAAGQLVVFDENGDPIAQDMPDVDTENLVTLEGGGSIDIAEVFGEGPYVISFTPDDIDQSDTMQLDVYDPQGKATDVFKYVDDAISDISISPDDILPAVTTADNGKFLRVKDGAWAVTTVRNAEEVSF